MSESTNEQSRRRGFASMSPERQREIASLGGRAAHQRGVAHRWDRQQAAEAGRKGGQNSKNKRNAFQESGRELK